MIETMNQWDTPATIKVAFNPYFKFNPYFRLHINYSDD